MNCVRCNMPLEANARFCRNCGQPVTSAANAAARPETNANSGSGKASPSPLYQPASNNTDAPTIPPTSWQAPSNVSSTADTPQQKPLYLPGQPGQSAQAQAAPTPQAQQWPQQQYQSRAQQQSPQQYQQQAWRPLPPQQPFAQPDRRNDVGAPRSGPPNQPQQRRKRRGRGLLIGLVVVIVLIAVLLVGGRFALNAFAISQINQTLSDAINNVPSEVALLPERDQTISESTVNALITQRSSASSPVQNLTIHFTPKDVEIDFDVFSFSSTITTVPKIVNGKLVATNVTVQGMAALILSPDDITNIMNTQITKLENHIQHTITAVTLENHAILLHIKPGTSTPTPPGTLPTSVPTSIPTSIPTVLPTISIP